MSLTSDPSRRTDAYVLDSWPFLEIALRGAFLPRFEALMARAVHDQALLFMSEINLGEVFYLVAKQNGEAEADAALQSVIQLPVRIVPVSHGDVLQAARLKARHRISYADCFCARVALTYDAAVVTGDRDFLELERSGLLRVEWLGA